VGVGVEPRALVGVERGILVAGERVASQAELADDVGAPLRGDPVGGAVCREAVGVLAGPGDGRQRRVEKDVVSRSAYVGTDSAVGSRSGIGTYRNRPSG